MEMMGMIKGTDRDGGDMKNKFEGAMEKRGGQEGGPPSKEKMEGMMKDKDGNKKNFNGGCSAEAKLCCGHVLEYGVWKDEYFCHDQFAMSIDSGHRFTCVEGMAKNP